MQASVSFTVGPAPRRAAVAARAAAPQATTAAPLRERSGAGVASSSGARQIVRFGDSNFEVDEAPELKSTWGQRATVLSSALAMGALLAQGCSHCDSALVGAAAALGGYVFADFGSGLYHWSVDNYGSASTPLVGAQIAAFQGHHQRPWTITQREFCNNVALTFRPPGAAAAALAMLSAATGATPAAWDIFAASACAFIAMSQQLHAWSHTRKSELPTVVVALQDTNLIISRRAHGVHHRAPFAINYCIVSGWCNPLLDAGLTRALEEAILRWRGIEPRGWSEPLLEWQELERPES